MKRRPDNSSGIAGLNHKGPQAQTQDPAFHHRLACKMGANLGGSFAVRSPLSTAAQLLSRVRLNVGTLRSRVWGWGFGVWGSGV